MTNVQAVEKCREYRITNADKIQLWFVSSDERKFIKEVFNLRGKDNEALHDARDAVVMYSDSKRKIDESFDWWDLMSAITFVIDDEKAFRGLAI